MLRPRKYDKELIGLFLVGRNRVVGGDFRVKSHPDDDSSQPNVDALAEDGRGQTLAIEHTLIEPFIEEKYDARRFWRVFGPLETDPSLRFSDYDIELYPKVGAVPKGVDLDEARKVVGRWVVSGADRFPFGESIQQIPDLPFEVNVLVLKNETALGRVFVGRSREPVTYESVIEKALGKKLSKLISCEPSRRILRILLLETETNEHNLAGITKAIEALRPKYPGLAGVDEVWVADTVSQESCDLRFCKVSPCDVPQRVFVRGTLTTKDSIPLGKMSFLQREPVT